MSFTELKPNVIPSYATATELEFSRVKLQLLRECSWYEQNPGLRLFETDEEIAEAASNNELVKIGITDNYRPVWKFLNPDHHQKYPPYLAPFAAEALADVMDNWRIRADELGVDPNTRLPITSLVRSKEYQNRLVEEGKLASIWSTHRYGGAFDVDMSGYWTVDEPNKILYEISLRPLEERERVVASVEQYLGETAIGQKDKITPDGLRVVRLGPEHFNPRVPQAFYAATQELHRQSLVNVVTEFPSSVSEVVHLAVHPNYVERKKRLLEQEMITLAA